VPQGRVTDGDDEGSYINCSQVCQSTQNRHWHIELFKYVRAVIYKAHDTVGPTGGLRVQAILQNFPPETASADDRDI